jgi:ribosomal protein L22
MARKKQLTKDEKRLRTLAIETDRQKKAIVDQVRKTPIVQLACERTGVGRSTYYSWRAKDKAFARAADSALRAGQFFINDMAESKIISMIQGGNLTATIFWLKHNHPKYAVTNRTIHEYEVVTKSPSVEERNAFNQQMGQIMAEKMMPKFSTEDIKKQIEGELERAEQNKEMNDKIKKYEGDPEEKNTS